MSRMVVGGRVFHRRRSSHLDTGAGKAEQPLSSTAPRLPQGKGDVASTRSGSSTFGSDFDCELSPCRRLHLEMYEMAQPALRPMRASPGFPFLATSPHNRILPNTLPPACHHAPSNPSATMSRKPRAPTGPKLTLNNTAGERLIGIFEGHSEPLDADGRMPDGRGRHIVILAHGLGAKTLFSSLSVSISLVSAICSRLSSRRSDVSTAFFSRRDCAAGSSSARLRHPENSTGAT
ncbi:hypothetical protein BDK51DRAFT_47575 [Blyttiomyces helicus]|uniref:Uncharacterized protein n=1 Tax=Blyttiomyces helicus TaxID=388810 RepID=A0A4P9WDH5_9FUNG|nr:hypothetical protein BDK51DRAFT_47575 [Blyttiomyces helicus]|eukprot:RKO89278.1 hypothetical protein BDK51DRAFT_47575 [Blyttiomyces helicus]